MTKSALSLGKVLPLVVVVALLWFAAFGFGYNLGQNNVQVVNNTVVKEVQVPQVVQDKDVFEKVYEDEIDTLEDNAQNDSEDEVSEDNYEVIVDYLEDTINNFDEVEDVNLDDSEAQYLELGLEEDEDKVAEVTLEYLVEYTLKEGETTTYLKLVTVTATVTYDEGDYSDEEVELQIA